MRSSIWIVPYLLDFINWLPAYKFSCTTYQSIMDFHFCITVWVGFMSNFSKCYTSVLQLTFWSCFVGLVHLANNQAHWLLKLFNAGIKLYVVEILSYLALLPVLVTGTSIFKFCIQYYSEYSIICFICLEQLFM